MGWHLCSGSNYDSLEVLPLCKDIHWLGYGSPVGEKKTSRKLGVSHYVDRGDNSDGRQTARQTSAYIWHTPPVWLKWWPVLLTSFMEIPQPEIKGLQHSASFVLDSLELSSLTDVYHSALFWLALIKLRCCLVHTAFIMGMGWCQRRLCWATSVLSLSFWATDDQTLLMTIKATKEKHQSSFNTYVNMTKHIPLLTIHK